MAKDKDGFDIDPRYQYYDTKSGQALTHQQAESGDRPKPNPKDSQGFDLDPRYQYYDEKGNALTYQEAVKRRGGGEQDSAGGAKGDATGSGTAGGAYGPGGAGAATTGKKTSGDDALPVFDNKRIYLVKGSSLNAIVNSIHANRVRVVQGGGLKIVSISDQGTFLAVDGTECAT